MPEVFDSLYLLRNENFLGGDIVGDPKTPLPGTFFTQEHAKVYLFM